MAVIRRPVRSEFLSIADLFLVSFRGALPSVKLAHSDDEVRAHFQESLLPNASVWVAEEDDEIVGFIAIKDRWVNQLYLSPNRCGFGIGCDLLAKAKEENPEGLKLYAFQCNARARGFYEKHGFRPVEFGDGTGNEEGEPDVLYEWP